MKSSASKKLSEGAQPESGPRIVTPEAIQAVALREDDFAFEMRVGNMLRRRFRNASVAHGGTYDDLATQKPRQFDFRCEAFWGDERLLLAVECKNIDPTHPLVVCGSDRVPSEAFHDMIQAERPALVNGMFAPNQKQASMSFRARSEETFYESHEFVGRSLLKLRWDRDGLVKTPDTEVYERYAQALASASDWAAYACKLLGETDFRTIKTIIIPAVVVPDEALWKIAYQNDGTMSSPPERSSRCSFYVGRKISLDTVGGSHPFTFSHLEFFTVRGLFDFLNILEHKPLFGQLFRYSERLME